jgi:hypothetical protein
MTSIVLYHFPVICASFVNAIVYFCYDATSYPRWLSLHCTISWRFYNEPKPLFHFRSFYVILVAPSSVHSHSIVSYVVRFYASFHDYDLLSSLQLYVSPLYTMFSYTSAPTGFLLYSFCACTYFHSQPILLCPSSRSRTLQNLPPRTFSQHIITFVRLLRNIYSDDK